MPIHDPYRNAYIRVVIERQRASYSGPVVNWSGDSDEAQFKTLVRILLYTRNNYITGFDQIHPAVIEALRQFGKPYDWHLLALEAPIAATDGQRVAYVRNEDKRKAHALDSTGNKHLTASPVAKYLRRHWPSVRDDQIAKLAASFQKQYKFLDKIEDMLAALQDCTADSCMSWSETDIAEAGGHPYQVYDPKYGWKLAVGYVDGKVVARGLALDDGENKCFVRTYGKLASDGYTQEDQGLSGWLENQGYKYLDEWPEGIKFAKVMGRHHYLAPYLDPGQNRIASYDSRKVTDGGDCWIRDDDGEYTWDNTDGRADGDEDDRVSCEHCGDRVDEDDTCGVGYYNEGCVCESCINEHYTSVIGRSGDRYFVRNEAAITTTDGDAYDRDYLSANDIVELYNGEYCSSSDAVWVEGAGAYWPDSEIADDPSNSGSVVYVEYARHGEYVLRDDAEWCEVMDKWITDSEAKEVAGGKFVHEDEIEDYLNGLPFDELEANCVSEDYDDALENWKAANPTFEIPDAADEDSAEPVAEPVVA